ncbi:hypothetical protein IFM89_023625 [Coptis chinensis]|uniref:Protein kinase domain-containing protein n=1 Tax=Coptis chinensis TaxID=261450 RepID=A0A835HM36_9MAGN|nr:hypothetical protein IFM89_023625 [Coptis chinensis]
MIEESLGDPQASRSSAPPKILPIEMPAISLDELKRLTSNFGTKALVGEGSYSRVFSATPILVSECGCKEARSPRTHKSRILILPRGLSTVSRLKHEHFVELLGYCLEANNRILIYQYATKGSLHDILHGREYRGLHLALFSAGTKESTFHITSHMLSH